MPQPARWKRALHVAQPSWLRVPAASSRRLQEQCQDAPKPPRSCLTVYARYHDNGSIPAKKHSKFLQELLKNMQLLPPGNKSDWSAVNRTQWTNSRLTGKYGVRAEHQPRANPAQRAEMFSKKAGLFQPRFSVVNSLVTFVFVAPGANWTGHCTLSRMNNCGALVMLVVNGLVAPSPLMVPAVCQLVLRRFELVWTT
jgi:hypothetical protein